MTAEELKKQLVANKQSGLGIDIDQTLSWTLGYWFEELKKRFGNPENLTTKEIIAKYRYSHHVPYWQTPAARAWMEEQRNSNDIQTQLPLIENANHVVQKIMLIAPIVAYITTRPESVISGTTRWLAKHNFPNLPIVARAPDVALRDGNQWKAEILPELYPEINGIIDDDPELVDKLPGDYPGAVYLYDVLDTPARTKLDVVACKTWDNVYKAIKLKNS